MEDGCSRLGLCWVGFAILMLPSHRDDPPWLACGAKIVEVTPGSVVVWARLTRRPQANFELIPPLPRGAVAPDDPKNAMPTDLVPGQQGWARVQFWPSERPESSRMTSWQPATEQTDCIVRFLLEDLTPGTRYRYAIETASTPDVAEMATRVEGEWRTAPSASDSQPITFLVTTCQAIQSADDREAGHDAYRGMRSMAPDFFVHTGDVVYYDKFPFARNVDQARAKWHTLYAYRKNREFHLRTPSYFIKDDHDTLRNDCWPGQKYGDLTFAQGQSIFREQTGTGPVPYRTFRWGRDLQIWLLENRDFRSPNRMPDGPAKTILGEAQKKWLRETLESSDATFKFVISPGPLVGPDKPGKQDNHANAAFATEGSALRKWLANQPQTYVICGDRHWQYSSRDPATGLLEFGCGPINDQHDFGGDPGRNPAYHRYFGARGGFLKVTVDGKQADVAWYVAESPDESAGKSNYRVAYRERLPLQPAAENGEGPGQTPPFNSRRRPRP